MSITKPFLFVTAVVLFGMLCSCSDPTKTNNQVTISKPLYAEKNSICIVTSGRIVRIPKVIDLNNKVPYAGIYEIKNHSIKKCYNLLLNREIYFTLFDTTGKGYTHLYVFDIDKKYMIKDLAFKHDYLYSEADKFIVDSNANKVFSIDKAALFGAKNITVASMCAVQGNHFIFFSNIYQEGHDIERGNSDDDIAVIKFYYKSLIDNGKHGLLLPKDWWKRRI